MADRPVLWTQAAAGDLDAIVDYIAAENPDAASQVLDRLHVRARSLEAQPERGRNVPELRGLAVASYRELIESPWRIVYLTGSDRVTVIAVLDGRRELRALLLERLLRS